MHWLQNCDVDKHFSVMNQHSIGISSV